MRKYDNPSVNDDATTHANDDDDDDEVDRRPRDARRLTRNIRYACSQRRVLLEEEAGGEGDVIGICVVYYLD
jgi:hypothetical protein